MNKGKYDNEISVGVEIVFMKKGKEEVKKYRAKDNFVKEIKDLMINEISNLAKIYDFEDVISIKFTG